MTFEDSNVYIISTYIKVRFNVFVAVVMYLTYDQYALLFPNPDKTTCECRFKRINHYKHLVYGGGKDEP